MNRHFFATLCGVFLFANALIQVQAAPKTPAVAKTPAIAKPPATPTANATGNAADVNGEAISMDDLNRMYENIKASEPAFQTNTPAAQKALSELKPQLLKELIATRLLSQAARKQNIKVDSKTIDASIAELKANFKTDAEFNSWLGDSGKTLPEVRKAMEDEYLIREYSKSITRDITVSGEDIAAYYRENLDKYPFTIPAGVHARHIMLALNPKAPADEKARVKKRALDLVKQLKGGANFITLARDNSDDQRTRNQGGDLGSFSRGASGIPSQVFDDAIFAAKAGEIVGPIETEFGFHIIKVDEIIPAKVQDLKSFQDNPQLKAVILKGKVQKRLEEKIAQLEASSKINRYI